jgi:hypothetical protein
LTFSQPSIRKLHIKTASGQDALLARLRVESALQTASLNPPGLPAAATLVIRRLSDERLGQLATSRPDFGATRAWAHTFDARVAQMAARAIRPLYESALETAEAVMFADQSELLACLALDWMDGAPRWWWRSLFPDVELGKLLYVAFVESAPDVPAALETLSRLGRAPDLARRLDAATARSILAAVLKAFELSTLEKAIFSPETLENQSETAYSHRVISQQNPEPAPGVDPFGEIIPEAGVPGLLPEARILLGVGLMLRRAPAVARSAGFAARVTAWQAQGGLFRVDEAPVGAPATVTESASGEEPAPIPPQKPLQPAIPARLAEKTILAPRSVTRTNFGGLFYLLNLAIYLEIYGDFSRPARPGWDLLPWDFLALLGRHWLGEALESDPLWAQLAAWVGRDPHEPPAEGFSPPPGWDEPFLQAGLPAAPPEAPWLGQLADYLRARLSLALGFDDIPLLLAQPAQVFVASSRLDVHFSLSGHPLEVRLAGLDRDLGWLPAAGFAIYYHFE